MIYPKFLHKNDLIGLPAPSNSLKQEDKIVFENAIKNLNKKGFSFVVSENAFNGYEFVSADAKTRAEEFISMWKDEKIKGLISLAGGEFMLEILPYLNDEILIKSTPKWFQGFSDNTILNHYILTHLETANIYHYNFKYFGQKKWHESVTDSFNCITGKKLTFKSYKKFQNERKLDAKPLESFNLTRKDIWKIATGENEVTLTGRTIGGCLDILVMFIGTKYDKTKEFIEKYKNDGFIWFLEACDLDSREIKRALWQLKENGWFKYVKGFVFGRSLMGETCDNLTNKSAILSILKDLSVPIVLNADIGHKPPTLPLIIGAVATLHYSKGKGEIKFDLV